MRKREEGWPLSRLSCLVMVEEEGKVWFARLGANGLYEFKKEENCAKLLKRFLDYPIDKGYLYHAVEKVGNILVLAPIAASKIALYDFATDKVEYLELMLAADERKVHYTGNSNFFKCFQHENNVYFWGYEYPAMLKIDIDTKQITYFTDWVKEVEKRIDKMSAGMGYVSDCVIVGDYAWALCECTDVVLRLDLRTDEIKVVDICSDLDIRCGICFDGNFWVTGYNENANKLLKYDFQFELEEEIEICSAQKDSDEYSFSLRDCFWASYPIIDLGEQLLLFSVYPRHVYKFDKTLHIVQICSAFEEIMEVREEKFHDMGVLAPRKRGDLVCFISGNDFLWNEYDFVHDNLMRYEVRAEDDDEFLKKSFKFITERISIENESPGNLGYRLTLSRYLEHVAYLTNVETDDKKEKLEKTICELLKKQCGEYVPKDRELLASGVIGSFQLFELICDLEETFNIRFRQEELKEVSNFSSVNAIMDTVKKHMILGNC